MMNKQFEEWYEQSQHVWFYFEELIDQGLHPRKFNELPFSMQWGVYLEFFESRGLLINREFTSYVIWDWREEEPKESIDCESEYCEDNTEAQQEAVNKAFEILEG